MASSQNFRTAFNGFNREDVVHYLEYINTKHTNQLNQLTAENESLRERLERLPDAGKPAAAGGIAGRKVPEPDRSAGRGHFPGVYPGTAAGSGSEPVCRIDAGAQAAQPEPETGLTPTGQR